MPCLFRLQYLRDFRRRRCAAAFALRIFLCFVRYIPAFADQAAIFTPAAAPAMASVVHIRDGMFKLAIVMPGTRYALLALLVVPAAFQYQQTLRVVAPGIAQFALAVILLLDLHSAGRIKLQRLAHRQIIRHRHAAAHGAIAKIIDTDAIELTLEYLPAAGDFSIRIINQQFAVHLSITQLVTGAQVARLVEALYRAIDTL